MVIEGDILIIGKGACASAAARLLVQKGIAVLWAGTEEGYRKNSSEPIDFKTISILNTDRLIGCRGQSGDFVVVFDKGGSNVTCHAKCVLIAFEELRHPNFESYGLRPSERVRSLSDMAPLLSDKGAATCFAPGDRVLMLNRWHPDTHPVVAARMMQLCLKIQRSAQVKTYFATGNLKVSVEGMERVFQEAKSAGTLFIRSSRYFPHFKPVADGRVEVEYHDEVTRNDFNMTVDAVIVDETLSVDPLLAQVGGLLRLEIDQSGFLQKNNVHRLSCETNRSGIFVADAARDFLTADGKRTEAKLAAQQVYSFLSGLDAGASFAVGIDVGSEVKSCEMAVEKPVLEIDQDECARCLTCYRLCTYGAITMSPRMEVHPDACQACGLCWTGCPNRAIQTDGGTLAETLSGLYQGEFGPGRRDGAKAVPRILTFCCRRSAFHARQMALCMGHRLPPGMVFVEGLCGGEISVNDLLGSFDAGADGVMVLTCHEGNCHSEYGTRYARKRTVEASRSLSLAGVSKERIFYATLASNMTHAFVKQTEDFAKKIGAMGRILPQ